MWEKSAGGGRFLTELTADGAQAVVAYGGRGGFGNVHFASSTNQEPLIALGGESGEEREIELEVKLFADVALLGAPNAGKSTLLSVISRAKPKIAAYPFTTLEPGFGVANAGDRVHGCTGCAGADRGSTRGAGAWGWNSCATAKGHGRFVHVVDGMAEDLADEYRVVREEVAAYGAGLAEKPCAVAVTKMDVPEARERYEAQRVALAAAVGHAPRGLRQLRGRGYPS